MKPVKCFVSLGFHESEFLVALADLLAYVDRRNVNVAVTPQGDRQIEGTVCAYILKEKDEEALVQLPGEMVSGGQRTWISKSLIAAA